MLIREGPLLRAFLFSVSLHVCVVLLYRPTTPVLMLDRSEMLTSERVQVRIRPVLSETDLTRRTQKNSSISGLSSPLPVVAAPKAARAGTEDLLPWMDRLVSEPMQRVSPDALLAKSPYRVDSPRAVARVAAREISAIEIGKRPLRLPPGEWSYSMEVERRPYLVDEIDWPLSAFPAVTQREEIIAAVFVGADGGVRSLQHISGDESLFTLIAERISRLRFDPGTANGVAINAIVLIAVTVVPEDD